MSLGLDKIIRQPNIDKVKNKFETLFENILEETPMAGLAVAYATILFMGPATTTKDIIREISKFSKGGSVTPQYYSKVFSQLTDEGLVLQPFGEEFDRENKMIINPSLLFELADTASDGADDIVNACEDAYQENFGPYGFKGLRDTRHMFELRGTESRIALSLICGWVRSLRSELDNREGPGKSECEKDKQLDFCMPYGKIFRDDSLRRLMHRSLDGLHARLRLFIGSQSETQGAEDKIVRFFADLKAVHTSIYKLPELKGTSGSFPYAALLRTLIIGDSFSAIYLRSPTYFSTDKFLGRFFYRDPAAARDLRSSLDYLQTLCSPVRTREIQ